MTKKLPTWRCADGRVLKLKDMEIGHLINTFHFLKRRARDEYNIHIGTLITIHVSVDQFCLAVWPIYGEFRKEIANRLRSMKQGSIERKYWHMKFSNDSSNKKHWRNADDEHAEYVPDNREANYRDWEN